MLSLQFRYPVLAAMHAQKVMRINTCFGILTHFLLTVFENHFYCRHRGGLLKDAVASPQSSTTPAVPGVLQTAMKKLVKGGISIHPHRNALKFH